MIFASQMIVQLTIKKKPYQDFYRILLNPQQCLIMQLKYYT